MYVLYILAMPPCEFKLATGLGERYFIVNIKFLMGYQYLSFQRTGPEFLVVACVYTIKPTHLWYISYSSNDSDCLLSKQVVN